MRPRAIALASCWFWLWGWSSVLACEPRDQTPVGRGGRIFQRSCSGCHGPDGRGATRLSVGMLRPPRDLTRADFHAHVSDAELLTVIRVGKGQMPAFGGLMADDDLRDVISYIRTLPPHSAPPAVAPGGPPASGTVAAPPNAAPGAAPMSPPAPAPAPPAEGPASPGQPPSSGEPTPGSHVAPEGVNEPAAVRMLGTIR